MRSSDALVWWGSALVAAGVLCVGAYVVALVDAAWHGALSGTGGRRIMSAPLAGLAVSVSRQTLRTEAPDRPLAVVAAIGYLALAAIGLSVVPLTESVVVVPTEVGIVVWGTVEALALVVLFMRGWSPNSLQALFAAYRFVAVGLSYLLLSMFVLIAAALPAQSLAITPIVDAQAGLWNVVRQPLGLPLFAIVALGTTWWGPFALAGGADLSGGVAAETSGCGLAVWRIARAMMLVSFSAMAAAVFLGGWHGPWLPGWAQMALKTLVVAVALVGTRHLFARVRAERFVTICWTVLLPLGFADLAIAGLESL